jgi:glycosyltransferase involved in cell wall biosynthesis
MDKKLTVGLIYSRNVAWIGGTYYIENIVSALAALPSSEQPALKIFCYTRSEFDELKRKTNYPHLSPVFLISQNFFLRSINAVAARIFSRHLFVPSLNTDIDILFPNPTDRRFDRFQNKMYWIPDFQDIYFPAFFSADELLIRKQQREQIVSENLPLILSSQDALNDLKKAIGKAELKRVHIVPFAVTIPAVHEINTRHVFAKFNISTEYFICSNQFWKHKNHKIVLEALVIGKRQNVKFNVVFTGNTSDTRNPGFFDEIQRFVTDHELGDQVKFLGFIGRQDQLVLMKNSIVIIQPSLFEGWSTVVEDAKALGHPIIASDLAVHKEQLGEGFPFFFQPNDAAQLFALMQQFGNKRTEQAAVMTNHNYKSDILRFARNFIRAVISESHFNMP